ncbi:MAG: hypothetical protein QXG86_01300 [Candidatus Woesearchaeota archaeon]
MSRKKIFFKQLFICFLVVLVLNGCKKDKETNSEIYSDQPTTITNENAIASGCVDSDGINISIRGNVTANGKTYFDECAGPFLIEYICESGGLSNQNFRCEKGCNRGACA